MSRPAHITALQRVQTALAAYLNEHGEGLLCAALLQDANANILSALRANEHEWDEERRADAEARRLFNESIAKNGRPDA